MDPINDNEKILLTGAAGRIGSVLRRGLRDRWRLRLLDRDAPACLDPREEAVEADIRESAPLVRAAQGCAAVIHLAGIPTEAPNDDLLDINARGTYNVLQAAVTAGCRRFVFASTNHVTGYYPADMRISPDVPVRPDGLYGASKVYGEALCRLHHDRDGLEVAVIRIGSPSDQPTSPRHAHTWLSLRDMIDLFCCCLTAPSFGWVVVYGGSANRQTYWDDTDARRRLGFHPVDDASPLVPPGPAEVNQGGRSAVTNVQTDEGEGHA